MTLVRLDHLPTVYFFFLLVLNLVSFRIIILSNSISSAARTGVFWGTFHCEQNAISAHLRKYLVSTVIIN
uniref:Putative origin recognition complex subunit 5 n=1 Tax=Ixodes ricinus TaxID=34613 RepID=A0A0K8R911_IXORI